MIKEWPERGRLLGLMSRLDSVAPSERGKAMEEAERQSTTQHFSTALKVARYLSAGGLTFKEIGDAMEAFPPLSGLVVPNLDEKRAYLNNMPLERFARMLKRFPPVSGISVENLEGKRRYFGMDVETFSKTIEACPSLANYSMGTIEARRRYLGADAKEFSGLVRNFPQVVELSEANLEAKFKFYEEKMGINRKEILDSIIDGRPKAKLSYSMRGRVLPRYLAYHRMIRKVDPVRFRTLLAYSEEMFPASLTPNHGALLINGELDRARKVYERAKELCGGMLRSTAGSTQRLALKAA